MSDIIPIREAASVGYTVFWSKDHAWFSFIENDRRYVNGPYKTVEDAAYAALADHEKITAIRRELAVWESA